MITIRRALALGFVSPEGYGLQAVRKCFAMNPALAAEGRFLIEAALFPQAV